MSTIKTKLMSCVCDPHHTFGWPTGKSLDEPTLAIFEKANIKPRFPHPRACIGTFDGLPCLNHLVRYKPSVIPMEVAAGRIAAGITGLDQVIEAGVMKRVKIVARLQFSRASNGGTRAVLVCCRHPRLSLDTLRAHPEPVISEYPRQTRRFLRKHGINAPVVACPGGVEAFVVRRIYNYAVVLVETGTSLKVNDLVEIATVFESETVLIANPKLCKVPYVGESVELLGKLLLGVIKARDERYLTMNVPEKKLEKVLNALPSLSSPTVQTLANGDYAVSSVVPLKELASLKALLIKLGATGIVELDAHSII